MNRDECKQLFDQQGYVAIEGLLDAAHIATLSAAVDHIHRQWLEQNRAEYVGRQLINMHSLTSRRCFDGDAARKALDLCVGKPYPFTSQYLDENVLPDEREMDDIRNNVWYRRAREVVTNRNTPGGQIKPET